MKKLLTATTLFTLLFSGSALAHHPLGGEMSNSIGSAILSGIAHPIIGLDHFAFIIMIGLLAIFQKNRLLLPLTFIGGELLGALLIVNNIALPFTELLVAASVLLIGVIVAYGRQIARNHMIAIAVGAGTLHGLALGTAVIGAEPTPIIAYLISFSIGQFLIAMFAGALGMKLWQIKIPTSISARLSGACALGIGATLLIENLESIII